MNNPIVSDVEITTDAEGRFNLNALHKASGAEKKHGPSYWLALNSTIALIEELKKSNTEIPVFSSRGKHGGTFAHELLAISYASWISPSFQLKVNQVFLDHKSGKSSQRIANPPAANLPDFTNPAEAARAWAEQFEQKTHAEQEVQRLNHVCNTVARQFVPGLTAPQFCRQLNGVNIQQVNNSLVNRGILIREKRGHSPSSTVRDKYFKGHTIPNEDGHVSHQPQLTQKGARWLYIQYLNNKLPMKQSWDGNLTHMVFTEQEVA
ncbi:KilA-N domain-containing protein [Sansalvadorimonas verongulae]|uniref:KilA-N domain-containing protein n=1 Tax=Sansalvadorimonas verongulae TaxID=2172824 RepID=UPI0012BCFA5A|nr:KilA-N domain-containing protein [Sansalvadorimonas verongulae]MTI12367.1 hypothetical protein [Sansalvadorimonas verongulae]